MSAPLKPWKETEGATGAEARAAELLKKALPPRELSPATQAQHLAVLRGDAAAPRRFRVPAPLAIAVLFGGSMALAATRPEVRQWVRAKLEAAGVVQRAPKKVVSGTPGVATAAVDVPVEPIALPLLPAPEPAATEVRDPAEAQPLAPAPKPEPVPAVAVRPKRKESGAPRGSKAGPSSGGGSAAARLDRAGAEKAATEPPAAEKALAERAEVEPPAPPAPTKVESAATPATGGGLLDKPDLPDMTRMFVPAKIELYLQRGDVDEAEELLGSLKGQFSDRLNLLRGEVHHARGRCKEANYFFTSVITSREATDGQFERALYGRAMCHAALGDAAASHADIDRHVGKYPNGRLKSADDKLHQR